MFAPALLDPLHAFNDRFGLQDHARAAPEGTVIHGAVLIPGELARVPALHIQQAVAHCFSGDAVTGYRLKHLRKKGYNTDPHRLKLRIPIDPNRTFFKVYLFNHLIRQVGNQPLTAVNTLCITFNHQNIIRTGSDQMTHLTQLLAGLS